MIPDDELPGIYRIAHCNPASAMGFTLKYNPAQPGSYDDEANMYRRNYDNAPTRTLVLQIAMSYSTLAEQESDDEEEKLKERKAYKKNEVTRIHSGLKPNEELTQEEEEDVYTDCDEDENDSDNSQTSTNHSIDNVEFEYTNQVCLNLGIDDEQRDAQRFVEMQKHEWMKTVGKSKYRRDKEMRGPMRFCHQKKLVAVRRLRVMTIMVECTPKIPRLIKSAHSGMMAVLIIRRAFLLMQKYKNDDCLNYLYDWCDAITLSICKLVWSHKRQQHKNAVLNDEPEDWNGGGKNYTGIEYPPSPPDDRVDNVIEEGLSYSKIWRFLQVIYGAVHLLLYQKQYLTYISSSPDEYNKIYQNGNSTTSISTTACLFSKSWGDAFAEICGLILTCDCYLAEKILYPELVAVTNSTSFVERKNLALRRESLTTSGQAMYIVDNAREIILYRSVMKPFSSRNNSSGDMQNNSYSTMNANVSTPPPSEESSSGIMSAAVTAATSLLYPPPPHPPQSEKVKDQNEDSKHKRKELVKNPKWLVNDIRRRLYVSPFVPRVFEAEAGKVSSGLFTGKSTSFD